MDLGFWGTGLRLPKILVHTSWAGAGEAEERLPWRVARGCALANSPSVSCTRLEPCLFQSPLHPGSSTGTIWEAPEAPSLPEPESPELRPAPLQPPSSPARPVRDGTGTNTSSAFIVPLSPTGQR